jgi:hypothetical protein
MKMEVKHNMRINDSDKLKLSPAHKKLLGAFKSQINGVRCMNKHLKSL